MTDEQMELELQIQATIAHFDDFWEGDREVQVSGRMAIYQMAVVKEPGGFRAMYSGSGEPYGPNDPEELAMRRSSRLYPTMKVAQAMAVRGAIKRALKNSKDNDINRAFFGCGS